MITSIDWDYTSLQKSMISEGKTCPDLTLGSMGGLVSFDDKLLVAATER
jgi:hypothetical protein